MVVAVTVSDVSEDEFALAAASAVLAAATAVLAAAYAAAAYAAYAA